MNYIRLLVVVFTFQVFYPSDCSFFENVSSNSTDQKLYMHLMAAKRTNGHSCLSPKYLYTVGGNEKSEVIRNWIDDTSIFKMYV